MSLLTISRVLAVTITAIGILLPDQLLAVPAAPGKFVLTQPDGEQITARMWGDENYHGYETMTGRAIVQDPITKQWCFGVMGWDNSIVSSDVRVSNSDDYDTMAQGFEPHIGRQAATSAFRVKPLKMQNTKESAAYLVPPVGTANVAVILANFSDTSTTNTPSHFNMLFFSTNNNSMADYFREVSYKKFRVTAGPSGIGGWYRLSSAHSYYGANDRYGQDFWPGDLVYQAVAAADAAGYNFAAYDKDGDCYVDVVSIIHQGTGEEASRIASDIWSHRWNLASANYFGYSHSGVYITNDACPTGGYMKVNDYIIQPERLLGRMTTIGVFSHEYSHSLGLPDLFDTDYSSEGVGDWSLMASGAWTYVTNPGDRPSHMDPWSKYKLGWITPTLVSGTLHKEPITAANTAADVYQLWPGNPSTGGEYFLVENRQKAGFDAGLPGSGLLIWHVDEALTNASNTDNVKECYPGGPSCASQHYHVALKQSDNLWQLEKNINRGDAGDPYPGTTNNNLFNAISSPASNFYSGTYSHVSLTNISDPASVMTATLSDNTVVPQVECLFNWAEKNYPRLFFPSGSPTVVSTLYNYRYYSASNAYLGVSSNNYHVYYLGPDRRLLDLQPLSDWLHKSNCQAPPPVECLFNWAERNYPSLFAPAESSTLVSTPYTYRYYSLTNAYLGVSSVDIHVYYMAPDGHLLNAGPLSDWLHKAACQ
jgi:immune inhibitor A